MASYFKARIVTGAIVSFAILASSAMTSEAASKAKPRKYIFDDLITPSMLAPPASPVRASVQGARFFSINSVLANLDGRPKADQPVRLASVTNDNVLSDVPAKLPADPNLQATGEPFGLVTFRAPEGILSRKWRTVKSSVSAEMHEIEKCKADVSSCSDAARRFLAIVNEVQNRNGSARLETANRLINGAIRYMSDLAQHGEIDVWSAPLASLETGRGDCEDYAIAKYVVLREAGIPEHDLRILLVRDRKAREDHAVLTVRSGDTWEILDNRIAALATDSDLLHFTPLFALDSSGVSLFASPYLTQRLSTDARTVLPASNATSDDDATDWLQEGAGGQFGRQLGNSGASTLPVLM